MDHQAPTDRVWGALAEQLTRPATLRVMIVLGVLALSAGVALIAPSGRIAMLLLALAPAVLAALFVARRLPLGVLTIMVAGLIVPVGLGTGTNTQLNPAIILIPLVLGLWLVSGIVNKEGIHLPNHRAVHLLVAFCAAVTLSFVVGQLPWFDIPGVSTAVQLGGLAVFLLSVAAFLLAAVLLDETWLRRLVYTFLTISAIYLLARLTPVIGPVVLRLFDQGAQGSVFWTWTLTLSAGLCLFDTTLGSRQRLALGVLAILTLAVALGASGEWASGWAPGTVAIAVLIWLRFPRWGWIPVVAVGILALFRFESIFAMSTGAESWFARQQAWQIVLDTSSVNPILGLGPANYYNYVQRASISGWGGDWNVRFSSHNNYIDLIAQSGILGLLLFAGFALVMARVGLRVLHNQQPGFRRAYAASCIAGLIGTLASGMLGDWFLPFPYNVGLAGMRSSILFWIFLGGLLALRLDELQPALAR